MHKNRQATVIGAIAAIAFSLAASTTVQANSMPPKYQGEWCQTAPDRDT